MLKTNKGLLASLCCLLLVCAFALPVAAQSTTPQQDRNPSDSRDVPPTVNGAPTNPDAEQPAVTTPNPNPELNRDVDSEQVTPQTPERNPSPATPPSQTTPSQTPSQTPERSVTPSRPTQDTAPATMPAQSTPSTARPTTAADRSAEAAEGSLPGTASGLPLVGLIGAASLLGAAIRRRF